VVGPEELLPVPLRLDGAQAPIGLFTTFARDRWPGAHVLAMAFPEIGMIWAVPRS
jgi:hypothetical protein